MLRFSGTGRTEVGLVRSDNEDSAFAGPTLLLVADGVGGNAGGEIASATTAYVVSAEALASTSSGSGADPADVLARAVADSNREIAAGVARHPDLHGMATTLTALLTDGHRTVLAHVGDSRGYVLRDDDLVRVTTDHTWVHDMVDSGRMSEADALVHPWRNVVLRTVNGEPGAHADLLPLDLRVDDRVLVCSDGVTDLVDEHALEEILRRHDDETAADEIVDAALAAGGRDNVTVVVATVLDTAESSSDGELLGAVRDPRNIIDPGAEHTGATA